MNWLRFGFSFSFLLFISVNLDDLVDRVASYEEKIKSLRLNYEDQLVMLRSQIAHLTAEVASFLGVII